MMGGLQWAELRPGSGECGVVGQAWVRVRGEGAGVSDLRLGSGQMRPRRAPDRSLVARASPAAPGLLRHGPGDAAWAGMVAVRDGRCATRTAGVLRHLCVASC